MARGTLAPARSMNVFMQARAMPNATDGVAGGEQQRARDAVERPVF